jgi:hypothetical protein
MGGGNRGPGDSSGCIWIVETLLFVWVLERQRENIQWGQLRIWWHLAMLAWGWAILGLAKAGAPDCLVGIGSAVYMFLNLPALVLIGLTFELLPDPLRIVCGSMAVLVGGYGMVCWAQWKAWPQSQSR